MLLFLLCLTQTMQAAIAVLRPKQHASFVASEFHPGLYEILLQETTKLPKRPPGGSRISEEEVAYERAPKKTMKHLPMTSVVLDNEPCDALLTYLYNVTGGDSGGLKGTALIALDYLIVCSVD